MTGRVVALYLDGHHSPIEMDITDEVREIIKKRLELQYPYCFDDVQRAHALQEMMAHVQTD